MNFLIDMQLPSALCGSLDARGHYADHVQHTAGAQADDRMIARAASLTRQIIITKDEDFVQIARAGHCRVVWLRCGNLRNPSLFA